MHTPIKPPALAELVVLFCCAAMTEKLKASTVVEDHIKAHQAVTLYSTVKLQQLFSGLHLFTVDGL